MSLIKQSYLMKPTTLVLMLAFLFGCSDIYEDLETAYGENEAPKNSIKLETKTFSVSSKNRKGIETYQGIASISISSRGVALDAGAPFTNSVFIPIEDIAGCAMTCFGTDDQHVDFLITKTGTDLMIQSSEELLSWCWKNKKPMFSGKSKRAWLYKSEPLPPSGDFEEQYNSREIFDKQKERSCLGY